MSAVLAKQVAQVLAALGAMGIPQMQQRTWTKLDAPGSPLPIACGASIMIVCLSYDLLVFDLRKFRSSLKSVHGRNCNERRPLLAASSKTDRSIKAEEI